MGVLRFKVQKEGSGSARVAIAVGLFVAFGGILFGYDTGTIGGILGMDYWIKEFARDQDENGNKYISSADKSLIVSILSVGTFFGALMSAQIADYFGRKYGLMISSVVFTVGVVFQTAATEIIMLVIGRLIAGLGVGLLSAQVPMYQSETSPKWIRGFVWALILFFGMMLLPETPRFLIKRNRFDDAAKSLSTLRRLPEDHPEILTELNEIKANHEYEMSIGQTSYKELLSNQSGFLRKRLLTGVGIQVFQQLSGANFIFYYGTTFFQSAGIKNSFVVSLITNCVNVVSTLPGLWLVDNWGRRNLLLFGAAGMFLCQFIVAIVGTISQSQAAHNTLVAFVCIYIFFFASSWGPVPVVKAGFFPWLTEDDNRQASGLGCGEIFPLKARAKGLSITTAANWLLNWAIGYATPYMVDRFIYETKGFTLEQVDEIYAKVPHAWKSPGFEPTVNFVEVAEEVQQQPYEGGRRPTLSEIEVSAIRRRSSVGIPDNDEKAVDHQIQ
ncbi:High-affinity glucose transporter rgt2 [Arthrobotrys megalospora]